PQLRAQGLAEATASPLDAFRAIGHAPVRGSIMPARADQVRAASGGPETNQVNLTMVQNVLPDSEPAMDGRTNELMLLYVSDNGSTNNLQFTDLKWTRWDGVNWSTPLTLRANTQAEFAPQVKYDGNGDAIAVWQRVADPNFTNTDLTAMAAQLEIVWSRWNRANGTWSEPAPLTTNNVLDHAPLLCGPMSNGDLLAVWTRNNANQLMGTNGPGADQLFWARWSTATRAWTAPQAMLSAVAYRLSQTLAGAGGHAVYAWSSDADGVLTNDEDQELFSCEWMNGTWSAAKRLTTNSVVDRTVRAAVAPDGAAYLVWQNSTNLVMSLDFSTSFSVVRPDSQSAGFADIALTLGPAGHLVVLWQEMSTNGSDAHYTVYDPASGGWSKDTLLCQDASLERSFAPVWDAVGNLTVAYNKVQVMLTNRTVTLEGGGTLTVTNVPQPGRVDLVVTKRALVKDLALLPGDFTVEGVNWLPGDPLKLTALVRNTGNVAVSNVVVSFYNGDPASGGVLLTNVTLPGWLDAAATNTASAVWVLPEPATNHVLYAFVNRTNAFTEYNENNNAQWLRIGGTDLAVNLMAYRAETNGSVRVLAQVQNVGAPAATNTVLAIRREGQTSVLAQTDVPGLEPGRLVQVALDLPAGTQREGEQAYRLFADDTRVIGDVNTNNNTTAFVVSLVIDSDGDGMPDSWELTYGLDPNNPADTSADPDKDGLANLQEYHAGTHPTVSQVQLNLVTGYNLVGLPFVGTTLPNAQALARAIPNCTSVSKWDATTQGWLSHPTD
ncbi:MAG: hypothetical protein FJ387_31345, partial [Verrucomicrobia bacterium]|nr:hypothetical protein [Verrucomicrobiota bacterium]